MKTHISQRTQKLTSLAFVLLTALSIQSAHAVNFHGYVRSGLHESTDGGQTAWLPGKLGRFGNETDGWWSMAFEQNVYEKDGKSMGVWAQMEGDVPLQKAAEYNYGDSFGGNGHMGITAYYVTAKGFISPIPEATLWVGKRSFQTHEIQMLDYKDIIATINGFGIEGIKTGPGELYVGLGRADADSASYNTYSAANTYDANGNIASTYYTQNSENVQFDVDVLDVRYSKIPLIGDSTLELMGQFAYVDKTDEQQDLIDQGLIPDAQNTFLPTILITKPLGLGYNETYLQYAKHRFANDFVSLTCNSEFCNSFDQDYSNAKAFRITNTGEAYLADKVIMAHSIVYAWGEDITPTLTKAHSFNVVARPAYLWNNNHKSQIELGWFKQVDEESGTSKEESGHKITLAHSITVGPSQFIRPEIRFYTTYLKADKNEIDDHTFTDGKNHEISYGVQVEAYW